MDLSGTWRAAAAREELRRTFHEPALDDRDWSDVSVPGHWANTAGLANERAVLHRRHFEMAPVDEGRRRWITLHGLAQQGDVWLNGAYVGDTDGYFVPHQFEITHLMRDGTDHVLAVDVTVPTFGDADERSNLMGAILDPELSGAAGRNPGGLWRPVTIHETGTTAIEHFRAVCVDANPARARMALRCVFDHPDGGPVVLRTNIAGTDHEFRHPAAVGENRVEWTVDIAEPDLWWPHSLGEQPLHDVTCELVVDGVVHDSRSVRTAFRTVRMRDWILSVNGVRLFAKGIVMLPTMPRPGDASAVQVAADVRAAQDAGLDLIRLVAHVAHPAVYETADELGMLIWQELPMRGVMARSVRGQAVRQTREMVDLLGHHPSVAVWCPHDEPFKRHLADHVTPPVVGQQRPSWNRAVLDISVRRVLQRTDGSRPIVIHTAVPPHLPQLDGTTSHLWFGWHDGEARDLAAALARVPRMGRFVTAFGAATVNPELPELTSARWPALNWHAVADAIGARPESLQHLMPPRLVEDGPTWGHLMGQAQADLIKTTIETLRKVKYRPTGGFCLHYLADPSTAGGFGVFDHDRRAKPSWTALIDACRPVIVVAEPLPWSMEVGDRWLAAVHVISDRPDALTEGVVTATITQGDGRTTTQRFGGEIAADSVERITTLVIEIETDGELTVDLAFEATGAHGPIATVNRYRTNVAT
ncbi:MAG: hypothetical protein AAGA37_09815 [Actinomycetota bacterium]